MAPNVVGTHKATMAWLADAAGISIEMLEDGCWSQRENGLYSGDVDLGFICGLPYVLHADHPDPCIQLLVAPAMAAPRYSGCPVYYSDVVVRADRPYQSVRDLAGVRWAYNEPNSQSGHNITQVHLTLQGLTWEHFGQVVCAGSHLESVRMILEGDVDAAAIDSTVLEAAPALAQQLRIIETFGPSPIPPLVASTRMAPSRIERLRDLLSHMHEDPAGQAILAAAAIARWAPVADADYDPIRAMNRLVAGLRQPHLSAA